MYYYPILLRDLPFVRTCIDDIIVMSRDQEEHLRHLRALFERLRQAHLNIRLDKYLRTQRGGFPRIHRVAARIPTAEEGGNAVQHFPKPSTPKALRRFLGVLNFYRRCLPQAAQQQAPLNEMLKGTRKGSRQKLRWTPAADAAFEAAKSSLAVASRATFLLPTSALRLCTDASDVAIGAGAASRWALATRGILLTQTHIDASPLQHL